MIGTWVDDSRYGKQVKVSEARPLPPTDVESVTTYLRRIKHVGGKRAAKLIERYGAAQVLDAIDDDPHAAFARGGDAPGLDRRGDGVVGADARLAAAAPAAGAARPRVSGPADPGDLRGLRASVVAERPYELTSVFGVGFLTADRIARGLGSPGGSTQRARAPPSCMCCPRPSAAAARACRSTCCWRRSTELLGSAPEPEPDRRACPRRRPDPRGPVDLPPPDGRARGRARLPRRGAGRRRPERAR